MGIKNIEVLKISFNRFSHWLFYSTRPAWCTVNEFRFVFRAIMATKIRSLTLLAYSNLVVDFIRYCSTDNYV